MAAAIMHDSGRLVNNSNEASTGVLRNPNFVVNQRFNELNQFEDRGLRAPVPKAKKR